MKIAIVGGGVSGLLCASLLEQKGYAPTIYERLPKVGGVFDSFKRKGIWFDIGFHYSGALAKGQYLYEALKRIGLIERVELEEYRGAFDSLYIDGEIFEIKGDSLSFQKYLKEHFPHESDAVDAFFDECRKASIINFNPEKFSDIDSRSLGDVMQEIKDEKLRKILFHFTFFYFYDEYGCEDAFFDFYAKIFINMLEGTRRVAGGGRAIIKALKESLRLTTIKTKSEVTKIYHDKNGVDSLVCNGKKTAYDVIISTLHPKTTLRLLEGLDKKQLRYKRHIDSLQESSSFFAVFCLIEKKIETNLYFYGDDFISVLPSRIYNGKTVATILAKSEYGKYAHLDKEEYERKKKEECDYHLQRLQTLYDFGTIEVIECSTPLTKQHYSNGNKGSIYGILCSAKQKSLSVLMPKTRVKNLYLAGESIIAPGFFGTFLGAEMLMNYFEERK